MAGRAMTVTIARRDGRSAVVAVRGEIDLHSSGELRGALMCLADAGHTRIVVDFSGVRFCDAAGLGVLVAVNNRLRQRDGTLSLVGVRPPQRKILRITGLDELFRPRDPADEVSLP
jgi:anti-sigma B factor antagonist